MTIWLNLIYKEWLEHCWKLVSLAAISFAVLTTVIADDLQAVATGFIIFGMGYGFIATIFVAIRIAAAEPSDGTIDHIRSLPVAAWKPGLVRIIAGAVVLLIPLISGWAGCQLAISAFPNQAPFLDQPATWGTTTALLFCLGFTVVLTLNIYLWCVAVAINMRSEIHTALVCVAVTVLVTLLGANALSRWDNHLPRIGWASVAVGGTGPLWPLMVMDGLTRLERYPSHYPPMDVRVPAVLATIQLLTIAALLVVAVRRYGHDEGISLPRITIERATTIGRALGAPLASPRKSLLWQRWQESAWQGFSCLGIVILLALFLPGERYHDRHTSSFFLVSGWLGCVLALILGVVSFTHDLEPKLHDFWRSRPIDTAQWFRMKYVAGLLVLLVCLHLPSLLILSLTGGPFEFSMSAYLCLMLLHVMIYGTGVLCACVVRHPLYAMILTICGVLATFAEPVLLDPIHGYGLANWTEDTGRFGLLTAMQFGGLGPLMIGLPYLAISIFAPLVAGTLLRRDVSISY